MNTRKEKMEEMRQKGLSYQAIGKLFNISRSRVHQIISGYSPDFSYSMIRTRKLIFLRDGHACQWGELCSPGKHRLKDLVVHHIDFNDNNNNPSNLITLCKKCHLKFHSRNHINDEIEKKLVNQKYKKVKENI
jgi:5-methylcytosine-specific restriction endonuclease McrA